MKSETSVAELEMIELLKECETIVEGSYLTTQDGGRIVDAGAKMLAQCERLKISRDNHATRVQEIRKQRDDKISDPKIKQLMLKAFKLGQKKYKADDYSIKLWIDGEIGDLRKRKANKTESAEKYKLRRNNGM